MDNAEFSCLATAEKDLRETSPILSVHDIPGDIRIPVYYAQLELIKLLSFSLECHQGSNYTDLKTYVVEVRLGGYAHWRGNMRGMVYLATVLESAKGIVRRYKKTADHMGILIEMRESRSKKLFCYHLNNLFYKLSCYKRKKELSLKEYTKLFYNKRYLRKKENELIKNGRLDL